MRDIPVFTTEYGAASLTLKEIPHQGKAYVRIQATQEPEKLIAECVGFCRTCGAEAVYATGHDALESYPYHTTILSMQCLKETLVRTDACLWPVREDTAKQWQSIYNAKIQNVPNAAWMTDADRRKMLSEGDSYYIHRNGALLGIGRASGKLIKWVAATQRNAGADVVRALANAICEDTVTLEVASTNEKAVRLYEALGFVANKEISKWYKIY